MRYHNHTFGSTAAEFGPHGRRIRGGGGDGGRARFVGRSRNAQKKRQIPFDS